MNQRIKPDFSHSAKYKLLSSNYSSLNILSLLSLEMLPIAKMVYRKKEKKKTTDKFNYREDECTTDSGKIKLRKDCLGEHLSKWQR